MLNIRLIAKLSPIQLKLYGTISRGTILGTEQNQNIFVYYISWRLATISPGGTTYEQPVYSKLEDIQVIFVGKHRFRQGVPLVDDSRKLETIISINAVADN